MRFSLLLRTQAVWTQGVRGKIFSCWHKTKTASAVASGILFLILICNSSNIGLKLLQTTYLILALCFEHTLL